ncbi:Fic family protein [Cruoricaptor ignavus]|uniref:Fic family protein n=1 Tax=Cruoricaptor ignavus TaxID=1118202 RepID=A0A7M1T0L4_9FLAO|nr:Fic family protein [Cruoricaptor ignavus]QOR73301.1 Fic family protein [Cruoricaptor ignavus]
MIGFREIYDKLFPQYLTEAQGVAEDFSLLKDAEVSAENFSFYTSVSSVFSSKIEGEEMELDSFLKHKNQLAEFQPDFTKKVDDLFDAYLFAQQNSLTKENIFEAHKILSRNILAKNQQGKIRTGNMFVMTEDGKIEYVAANPEALENEMKSFVDEVKDLICEELTINETLFFASLIHLTFVKIHPMNDGNGRLARLLEKWFLAEKLGEKAWLIQSEKFYYRHHNLYYQNLRKLGLEFDFLDFGKALDFLLMLPNSLKIKQ